jgi:SEC-C motif-containing protein
MTVKNRFRGPCPCGSRLAYERCCQRWHDGEAAPDAEALMRSRYVAYVLGLEVYLLATWHPGTRPAELSPGALQRRWLGLKVLRHDPLEPGGAVVEFIARYKSGGRAHELRETSRFVREDGRWLYVDGDIAR